VKTGGFLFVEKEKTEERERPGRKKGRGLWAKKVFGKGI